MDTRSSPLPPRDRPPFDQADSATDADSAALRHSFTQLEALAERCEQATAEQQVDLLERAYSLIRGEPFSQDFTDKLRAKAFVDAALTLVPEGLEGGFWPAPGDKFKAALYERTPLRNVVLELTSEPAATPALALTAAALRAEATSLRRQA